MRCAQFLEACSDSKYSIARRSSRAQPEPPNGQSPSGGARAQHLQDTSAELNSAADGNSGAEDVEDQAKGGLDTPQSQTDIGGTVSDGHDVLRSAQRASAPLPMASAQSSGTFDSESSLEMDPNEGRRKRQKTASESKKVSSRKPHTSSIQQQLTGATFDPTPDVSRNQASETNSEALAPPILSQKSDEVGTEQMSFSEEVKDQVQESVGCHSPKKEMYMQECLSKTDQSMEPKMGPPQAKTPPKKMMKLHTDGRLLSPRSPGEQQPKSKRGRRPKVEFLKEKKIVILRYGRDKTSQNTFGQKIDLILADSLRISSVNKTNSFQASPNSSDPPKTTQPPKKTHPFFLGQVKPLPAPSIHCSPTETTIHPSPQNEGPGAAANPKPTSTFKSSLSLQRPKFPKLILPPWPSADMAHVRGLDQVFQNLSIQPPRAAELFRSFTKLKEPWTRLEPGQDFLAKFGDLVRAENEAVKAREPKQQTFSGKDLSSAVSDQLTKDTLLSSAQSINKRMLEELPKIRSAFDKFSCETLDWTTKYAPKCTSDILQNDRLMTLVRDWLQGLKVNAVPGQSSRKAIAEIAAKKKRKHPSDLDDFIISADEDEDSEGQEDAGNSDKGTEPSIGRYSFRKTVLQVPGKVALQKLTSQSSFKSRAVIISGPHGCGKTAAIYAIAKELGFEVFEINSGSRRSGRDLLSRIGNMAHNHLVHGADSDDGTSDTEVDQLNAEFENGQQSTMQRLFTSRVIKQPTSVKMAKKEKKVASKFAHKKYKPKKQSLILLEEVDILFEEDRGFWDAVATLLQSSRRPIIMTCADESLLPVNSLQSCSVLRLSHAPSDIAVDYLMLLAAHEGHLLSRHAVDRLYAITHNDLRSSISQLQFWCQMGLGDELGGLGWILPPGVLNLSDNDDSPKRMISQATYLPFMGMLWWNAPEDDHINLEHGIDVLREAADDWSYDIGDWTDFNNYQLENTFADSPSRFDDLCLMDTTCEAISAADILIGSQMFAGATVDPPVTGNEILNYTVGHRLLQDDKPWDHAYILEEILPKDMVLALKFSAKTLAVGSNGSINRDTITHDILAQKADLKAHTCLISYNLKTALEPLASSENDSSVGKGNSILASESPLSAISTEYAPYVRYIASYDIELEQKRLRLSNLLSEGGQLFKKQRMTRASIAALEGGSKATTRRERWFTHKLNFPLVLETGGEGWQDALENVMTKKAEAAEKQATARSSEGGDGMDIS